MKFCQFITSIYPHRTTSFGQFNLIFNEIELIFLGVLIVFTFSQKLQQKPKPVPEF